MHRKKLGLITVCLLAMLAQIHSAAADDFYVDAGIMQMLAEIDSIDRDPILLRAKVGYYVTKNASIELQVATTVNKDRYANSELSPSIVGLYMRYGSLASSRERAYVHLGVAHVAVLKEIDTKEFGQEFNDISAGIGIEERLKHLKNASVTFEYTRYHSKDDTPINGLTLGFRTDF